MSISWLWLSLSIDDDSSSFAIILWLALVVLEILFIVWSIINLKQKTTDLFNDTDYTNTKHRFDKYSTNSFLSSHNIYKPIIKNSSLTDNLNYDIYIFSAISKSTKRKHINKTVEVVLGMSVIEEIKNLGYEEPIEYHKSTAPQATETQKKYYKDLTQKDLPSNASKIDASALISRYLDSDLYSPNPDLIFYGTKNKIKFSYYI